MVMASSKKYVIAKGGRFATVAGGLGSRPKVYPSMTAAQYDIDTNVKLKGGIIQPYVAENGPVAAPGVSAVAPATPVTATTTKAKVATAKQPARPKKASAGK
jgi:hypothetical protein